MGRLAGGAAGALLALWPALALALTSTPNDPYFRAGYQWALTGNVSSTNAPSAWCGTTGAGILIADIDTGADFNHPDLAGKLVVGANFTSGNANPGPDPQPDATSESSVMDDYGHGTMTTGLMVASTNNGVGIASEAPGARALIVKVFSNKGGSSGYSAYESDVAAGIYWSVEHGARVVNLSLGPLVASILPGVTGDPIPAAVEWAAQQGTAVAIAAGNGVADAGIFWPTPNYPQLEPYALVAGAMGPSGAEASYSQSGNIYAPGGDGSGGDPNADVLSTFPTYGLPSANQPMSANNGAGYASYDGTSFATPYAAGTLALLMARGESASQARSRIQATAKKVGGLPVLDAAAATGACQSAPAAAGCCSSAASSGGTRTTTTKPGPAAASPSPAAVQAVAAHGGSGATPPAAAAVAGRSLPDKPPAVPVVALIVLGAGCLLGFAAWALRSRFGPRSP